MELKGRRGRIAFALGLLCVAALAWCGAATGQDLSVALSESQSRVASATADVSRLEAELPPAQERLRTSSRRAGPVAGAARAADGRAAAIESRLRDRRQTAAATLARLEKERRDAAARHDQTIRFGLGFALAMLVAAGIALAWDWFRATDLVAWLTRMPRSQAIGLCVGGGLLLVIVGAALIDAGGALGVIGVALFFLGFVFANALVLARHSAEIQGGRERPVLGRERLPRRAVQTLATVLGALCLIGLGSAVFAGDASNSTASAALRYRASDRAVRTPELDRARRNAAMLGGRASALIAIAERDRRNLQAVRRELSRSHARLIAAEGDVSRYERQLAIVERRRQAQAERQAKQEAASQCDPSYSGCLDPSASDYDCEGGSGDGPLYTGTVQVLGDDHYGLDADGDGIGCDN